MVQPAQPIRLVVDNNFQKDLSGHPFFGLPTFLCVYPKLRASNKIETPRLLVKR